MVPCVPPSRPSAPFRVNPMFCSLVSAFVVSSVQRVCKVRADWKGWSTLPGMRRTQRKVRPVRSVADKRSLSSASCNFRISARLDSSSERRYLRLVRSWAAPFSSFLRMAVTRTVTTTRLYAIVRVWWSTQQMGPLASYSNDGVQAASRALRPHGS